MTALAGRMRSKGLYRFASAAWAVGLAAAAATGIALRVWVYRSSRGVPNSDEAVMGLMARHIIHGEVPTFFWGAAYSGSQEALLSVPGFLIAGSGWLALRLVPITLSALAALLIWRVGLRTVGEPAAAAGAALFWIWPPFVIDQLTEEIGSYASGVVYCGLLLLLALRIAERPDRIRVGLFGLALGLAFWETPQIIPIAAGVIAWLIWRVPSWLRRLWVAVPLAALGSLPWIIWNVTHGLGSLSVQSGGGSSYAHRLRLFFSPVMPMIVGLRTPFTQERLLPASLTFLIYAALVALFIAGAYRARHRSSSLLYLVAAVFPFVYAFGAQAVISNEPRYVVILTPVLALLVAQGMTTRPRAAAVLLAAAAVSIVTLHRTAAVPTAQPIAPRDLSPLISTLDKLHLDRVYASYWVAYVLDFDTRERIIAVENKFDRVTFVDGQAIPADDPFVKYPPYQREVKAAQHGFVFFRKSVGSIPIVARLEQHGYHRYLVGGFVVFAPPAGSG